MNLLPLGQDTAASDEQAFFFDTPIDSITASSAEGEEPTFLKNTPVYYLHRSYSDTKDRWEMLTGLDFDSSTPTVIADAFKRVVLKNLNPGPQRDRFGTWKGYLVSPPTASEQVQLDQMARSNLASIEVGTIVEGTNPANSQEQMMHVDYFVTVDPQQLDSQEFASGGLSDRTKVAGVAGLVVGGIATSLLVRKGFGPKLLAGFAGGVITAGIFMSAIRATEREVA